MAFEDGDPATLLAASCDEMMHKADSRREPTNMEASSGHDVTVIIPVYNRAEALRAVAPSYLTSPHVQRLILVDDASTDATPQVMAEIAETSRVPVEIVRGPNRSGQPRARNRGIEQLNTEWALMGEDDVFLADDYIDLLCRHAHEYAADIIAGRLVNIAVPETFSLNLLHESQSTYSIEEDRIFDLSLFRMEFSARPTRPVAAPFLHAITLVHRRVFDVVRFDPGFGGNSVREETDFHLAATAAGFRLIFTPDTVCYHLRGPIAGSGGQRMPRHKMEYWNIVNTYRLVRKHWPFLQAEHGFQGTPTAWILRYVWQRYRHVLRHALTRGTLQPKNRL